VKDALDIRKLSEALGTPDRLPSPEELQKLLSDAEIGLFTHQSEFDPTLLETAWYLQSVATARRDLQIYDLPRQRRAHQVSAHIFDLALQSESLSTNERFRYIFAAQIGYLGGELTPNAAAIARSMPPSYEINARSDPGLVSLEIGIRILELNRKEAYFLLRSRIEFLDILASDLGELETSPFAAVKGVVQGSWKLINYLTHGQSVLLEEAMESFTRSIDSPFAATDVDSRWVAANLLGLCEDLGKSSVWSVMPPNLVNSARAMTLGDPPVLQLWPPQLAFLEPNQSGVSPLDSSIKRLVLSFPTSSGKSLLAQLFVTSHLVATDSDVCVVAPTHSLGRELASGLQKRLRTLGHELNYEGLLGFTQSKPPTVRVSVMTPEKLSARLRSDPAGLLSEFGMFVFDEAHLMGDHSRGWRLEETISFIHHITKTTHHRMILLSAALGDQAHVTAWLGGDGDGFSQHSDWRAPRRLHVLFSTEIDFSDRERIEQIGTRLPRERFNIFGFVRLKTPVEGSDWVTRRFSDPVGVYVRRQKRTGGFTRDSESTSLNHQLLQLISHVTVGGPILVVVATRLRAESLAGEIASEFDDSEPGPASLIGLVRARMGGTHLLAQYLEKGVAYHHSTLSIDIKIEIEEAVRRGEIRCLVATSTLSEGVNLPFKSVLIAETEVGYGDQAVEIIDAPRLLNTIGRAGRAGRETEGWLILAKHARFNTEMMSAFDPSEEDLMLHSVFTGKLALELVEAFDQSIRAAEDAVLSVRDAIPSGFISYVWFLAYALEEIRGSVTEDSLIEAIQDTFAWRNLSDDTRAGIRMVTTETLRNYASKPPEQRTKWAQSGLPIHSAASVESIAQELSKAWSASPPTTTRDALKLAVGAGRFDQYISIMDTPWKGFKPRVGASATSILDIDMLAILEKWVSGAEIQELSDEFLTGVTAEDSRERQLTTFISTVLEHHLPWAVGTAIDWANKILETNGNTDLIPLTIPGLIHFGVGDENALDLMLGGIRSRRLANVISAKYSEAIDESGTFITSDLRSWLVELDIGVWRELFAPSVSEIVDLLSFVRAPESTLVPQVLASE